MCWKCDFKFQLYYKYNVMKVWLQVPFILQVQCDESVTLSSIYITGTMWWKCDFKFHLYYRYNVLEAHKSTGIGDIGGVKYTLCLCLVGVMTTIYFALFKGVKSSGKVCCLSRMIYSGVLS